GRIERTGAGTQGRTQSNPESERHAAAHGEFPDILSPAPSTAPSRHRRPAHREERGAALQPARKRRNGSGAHVGERYPLSRPPSVSAPSFRGGSQRASALPPPRRPPLRPPHP